MRTPVFSPDLSSQRLRFDGRELTAASIDERLKKTVLIEHDLFARLVGFESIGYDDISLYPSTHFSGESADWKDLTNKIVNHFSNSDELLEVSRKETIASNQKLTANYRLNLLILTAISILVAGLFLWNIAQLKVQTSRRTIAILVQQGAGPRLIMAMLVFEAILMSIVGSLLGVILGSFLEQMLSSLTLETLSEVYVKTYVFQDINWGPKVFAALGFGILFYFAVNLRMTWLLLSTSPDYIRGREPVEKSRAKVPWLWVLLSAGMVLGGPQIPNLYLPLFSEQAQPYGSYVAAFGILMLCIQLSSLGGGAIHRIINTLSRLPVIKHLPSFLIAGKKFGYSVTRNRSSIATLSCSLALALGISLMVSTFKFSLIDWFDRVFKSELIAAGKVMTNRSLLPIIPSRTVEEINMLPQVNGTDCLVQGEGKLRKRSIRVFAVEYASSKGGFSIPLVFLQGGKEIQTGADFHRNMAQGDIIINEPLANKLKLAVGDTIPLQVDGESEKLRRIKGVVRDYGSEGGFALLPLTHSPSLSAVHGCHNLRLYSDDSPSDTIEAITSVDPQQEKLSLQTEDRLRSFMVETFDQSFAITSMMVVICILLGGLALLVHVAQSTNERRDEWLSLRRTGISWRGLWKIAVWDSVFLIFAGSLVGFFGGICLAAVLIFVINVNSFGWSFNLSWGEIVQTTVRIVPFYGLVLVGLSALITIAMIRPGEKWRRIQE